MENRCSVLLLALGLVWASPFALSPSARADEEPADGPGDGEVAARPWYQRFELNGFVAAGYTHTERDVALYKNGHFGVKQAYLLFEAQPWENVSAFVEWQAIVPYLNTSPGPIGEAYVHFKNVFGAAGDDTVGIKVGRVDIPFGEEYLWEDASDNPLITWAIAYPWGTDEGLLLYGRLKGVNWVTALTDGSRSRNTTERGPKSFNAKLFGSPVEPLHLSASYMFHGAVVQSAMFFGGETTLDAAALGLSELSAHFYELAGKYEFGPIAGLGAGMTGHLEYGFGQVLPFNDGAGFRRVISYHRVEPRVNLTPELYVMGRYSVIGTFKGSEGYLFRGGYFASGGDYGYQTRSLSRLSLGAGYRLNMNVVLKAEYSKDTFTLIDSATQAPKNARNFFGVEVVAKF